ncbi:T9SS-dependent M36 family metallopeptidase [Chryseobacterium sp. FH1]|uniref:T9SS-dependent M36 family metallopeptidase n=1 Tax=Chryseobacterium sp. FH1 TaxID=1233951 RepID=UPI0006903820|nr:T9SS-dependent M36 family metallopeptidase [Chryseobacterium sp. FH1]
MKINQLPKCVGIGAFFLFANLNAQSNERLIKDFIKNDISARGIENAEFKILNEDKSASLKSDIVNVQQYHGNTPIYHSLAKAIIREGKVISFNNNFLKKSLNVIDDRIGKSEALSHALRHLNVSKNLHIVDEKGEEMINLPDDKVASVRFYYAKENSLIPAQLMVINQTAEKLHYLVLVSLTDGEILESQNMLIECSFDEHAFSEETETPNNHLLSHIYNQESNSKVQKTNQTKAVTDASYNVFPFPIEAPTFGSRSIVNNPWDLSASPEGWHSNGNTTFNYTRGNNVFAYVDNNATNSIGFYPTSSTTGSFTFDFPYQEGTTISAYYNKSSSVTNLFYANNLIHDIFYKFGFTEVNRNFQSNNFGKGGVGNDAVFAEAFDGSGYNNANFNPGFEMTSGAVQAPRMQMYLWNNGIGLKQRLFYNDAEYASRPPVFTGQLSYSTTGVGRLLMETGVTGDVAIPALNSNTNIADACTALTANSLSGKIALVTYTGCSLDTKVRNAKNAGAVGVIIHRTITNAGDVGINVPAPDINIPSIILGTAESTFLRDEIANGKTINVTLKDLGVGYKNSSLDNGVVIHEYGHGISNRLTGVGYSCLSNLEQMGEGWSDFFAYMLTNTPEDSSSTARGIGTYSSNQTTTGTGIRTYKYSTNMSVNPLTYKNTNTTGGQPHAVGQIWATMLWDLHWKMAEKYGYNSDVTADPNSGSAKTLQLVMDGLKLQPCSPSFVSGRDAILQADALNGGNDNCLIWNVFARRGLGQSASAGAANNITDQVEAFDVPEGCILGTDDIVKNKSFGIYPNPAKGEFFIKTAPTVGSATVKIDIIDLSGKVVKSLERKKNSSDSVSTQGLIKGTYLVVITENGKSDAQKLIVE